MGAKEKLELMELAGQKIKCVTIVAEEGYVHIYFVTNDHEEPFSLESQLLNESRYQNIGRGYSIRFDKNKYGFFSDNSKDHIHIFKHEREIGAVNRDGTRHDGSYSLTIPEYAARAIRQKFPDFNIPNDRIIESMSRIDKSLEECVLYLIDCQERQLLED